MNNLLDDKKDIRKEYRRLRDAFVLQLDRATLTLAFRIPPTPMAELIEQAESIALYSATGSEVGTKKLAEYLADRQKSILFPKVTGSGSLDFRAVSNIDLLQPGFKDILEPPSDCAVVEPDLIIAPLLAFDRSMNRLGQGGGHYDRTFEKYPEAVRIGLAWSVQESSQLPTEPHDVDLHMIVTESEIIQRDNLTS